MATVPITDLAMVIRTKNSGPFELTMDIIMKDKASYQVVKRSGVISHQLISDLYKIPRDKILVLEPFDAANAYKITIVRPVDSGSAGETDTYGAQQHAPLLTIRVPVDA